MYATSVGLIMKGFEYLETYKKKFVAGPKTEQSALKPEMKTEEVVVENLVDQPVQEIDDDEDDRISLTDKIKSMLTKIFEVEDQSIS